MDVRYKVTMAALIGCISIYGITSSLLTQLISIILENRKVNTTIIGGMAMIAPAGLILGSFFVSKIMRSLSGRQLLISGIVFEIILIIAIMHTQSILLWFLIRFFGGFADSILFVVTKHGY